MPPCTGSPGCSRPARTPGSSLAGWRSWRVKTSAWPTPGLVVAVALARARLRRTARGQLNLAQAAVYLATAPKSNGSAMAIWNARADVANGALARCPPTCGMPTTRERRCWDTAPATSTLMTTRADGSLRRTCPTASSGGRGTGRPLMGTSRRSRSACASKRSRIGPRSGVRIGPMDGRRGMTAGELALVIGAVLCAIVFAGLAVTLVRVRDTIVQLRDDVAGCAPRPRRCGLPPPMPGMWSRRPTPTWTGSTGCSDRPRRSAGRSAGRTGSPAPRFHADDQGRRDRDGHVASRQKLRKGA